jgi:2-deoxy-D-gluconate 3-dehydrogenase
MSHIFDKFKLDGQTAIVTGGAGLLGRQFCQTLAQAGAKVVVADLNQKVAELEAEKLSADGYSAIGVGVDVTNPGSTQEMVLATLKAFGRLDILVCSAAMDPKFDAENQDKQKGNAFETYPLDAWKQALDVNLTGLFLCCQSAVQPMLEQNHGVLINICSTYGLVGDRKSHV